MKYACFTHVIQVYSLHIYCMCRTTYVMKVYILQMYYMCTKTYAIHVADKYAMYMFYT